MGKNDMDINKLEDLFAKYANMIYRLALLRVQNTSDAEDIVQEVFMRCMKNDPDFQSEEHSRAWLIKVAVNCSKSLLNSAYRRRSMLTSEWNTAGWQSEPSDVYWAVFNLPLNLRTVIHLYYYEGYAVKEIANIMDCPENTVKSYLFRAREQLRDIMEGEDFDV